MDNILEATKDLEVGNNLSEALGLMSWELSDPTIVSKITEIADFLNNHPDPNFIIGTLQRSNSRVNSRPIDHFLSYIRLQQEKGDLMSKIEELQKQIKYYE